MKAFIFDMDGVIVNTEPIHKRVWLEFFHSKGVHLDDSASFAGRSGVEVVKTHMPHVSHEEAMELRNERGRDFEEEYKRYKGGMPLVPGFLEFFREAKEKGLKVAVATSAVKRRAEMILKDVGILDELDTLTVADDVERGKPEPDMFLLAAKRMGMTPDECIVFEDALTGIEAARRAHMQKVLIMTSHKKDEVEEVDFAFNDFTEFGVDDLMSS